MTIHERAENLRAVGAGLFLWDNALAILRRFGMEQEVLDNAVQLGIRLTKDHFDNAVGSVRWNADGRNIFIVSRAQLLKALYDGAVRAGITVMLGSEVVGAEPEGVLILRNGARRRADLVAIADGVHSPIVAQHNLMRSKRVMPTGAVRIVVPRTMVEQAQEEPPIMNYWNGCRRVFFTPCSSTAL